MEEEEISNNYVCIDNIVDITDKMMEALSLKDLLDEQLSTCVRSPRAMRSPRPIKSIPVISVNTQTSCSLVHEALNEVSPKNSSTAITITIGTSSTTGTPSTPTITDIVVTTRPKEFSFTDADKSHRVTERGSSLDDYVVPRSRSKSPVIRVVQAIISKPGAIIKKGREMNIVELGKTIVSGRGTYTPAAQLVVDEFGEQMVSSATLTRIPMSKMLQKAATDIANGPFEKYYHLSMIVTCGEGEDKTEILLEKDFVVKLKLNQKIRPNTEFRPILDYIPMTFNELLNKTAYKMGEDFWQYSAVSSNCQHFILGLVRSLVDEVRLTEFSRFVKQDTSAVFRSNKSLLLICNIVTGYQARVEILSSGVGKRRRSKSIT